MPCEFEVFQDAKREYRWRFKAANGEVVADSAESYRTKSKCLNGIRVVQEGSPGAEINDHTQKTVEKKSGRPKKEKVTPET